MPSPRVRKIGEFLMDGSDGRQYRVHRFVREIDTGDGRPLTETPFLWTADGRDVYPRAAGGWLIDDSDITLTYDGPGDPNAPVK